MSIIVSRYRNLVAAAVLILFTALLGLSSVGEVSAINCAVPSAGYATIQSAVDDPNCAVIEVGAGTFYEQVAINRPLTLSGSKDAPTVIDGVANGSVLTIKTTAVTLQDLTIINGSAQSGGGIFNDGTALSISDCTVVANNASGSGGGIFSQSSDLTMTRTAITNNRADTGGGVYVDSGTVQISKSTIGSNESSFHAGGIYLGSETETWLTKVAVDNNTCYVDGGGIFSNGTLTVSESSITNNRSTSYSGGAIRIEGGTIYINNSTISKNKSGLGGAIDSWAGALRINSSTISQNDGSPVLDNYSGNVRIKNSIISGNLAQNCRGTINSDGYNLVSSTQDCEFRSSAGDLLEISANLGALKGTPAYHALKFGPGVNAGNPDGCKDHLGQLLETDQRGQPRQGICDMGAFEYQGEYHRAFVPLTMTYVCLDFFDDFSDPKSGWEDGEDDLVQFGYKQGEYQIRSKNDEYLYLFSSPACDRESSIVEADARWAGDPGLAYGLVFSIKENFSHYYMFAVNSEYQVFWLDYRGPNGWTTLVEPTQTGYINKDRAANHLQIVRDDKRISLSVNGHLLRQLSDSRITGLAGAGLFAAPYDGEPVADARFDNFASRNLVPTGTAIPAEHARTADTGEKQPDLQEVEAID